MAISIVAIAMIGFTAPGAAQRAAGPRRAAPPAALAATIDATVADATRDGRTPGVSVAVARGGRIVYAKGYGLANVELKVPATTDTVYRVGSITKQFTAAAIMQLIEQGKMSLDDPIEKFLPDYPIRGRHITIRHLLNHTSGIRSYTSLGLKFLAVTRQDLRHEDLIALFKDEPDDFQPGEKWLYDNSGYYLLGVILEKVTGDKYGEYVQRQLFAPLGLSSTIYCDVEPIVKNRASGYQIGLDKQLRNADFISMKNPFAAGSLCSTVKDLVAWTSALAGGKVVTAASYAQMIAPTKLADGKEQAYGFGLMPGQLEGHPQIAHGGGINGFASMLMYFPKDDVTVVVLTNSSVGASTRIATRVARAALGLPPQGS
jgi:CubicO group peptidase (beta-lactamase class C family)